ncbi:GAP family protein [Actinomadura sp. KC216]|uniref:GAP family protein n=1 Tax=Actinomadura sp. KC216 TaxID=2530370 RepID=UPI0010458B41|nr:GAP family protein [Actinomadura sp. KC216]TDB87071.1 GAP family protein [Actinomadura sp. KC216]
MGEVIGNLLPLAVAVAVSPIPIIAVILMLLSRQARTTGRGFLAGWAAGIVVATTILVVIANAIGMNGPAGEPKTPVSWIEMLLGVLVLTLAARQWTSRPGEGTQAEVPSWMRAIDEVTPARAATLGLMLSAVNPKNLMMCVAAGIAIAQGELGIGEEVGAVAVFSVIAVCSVAIPVLLYVTDAERMRGPLDDLKAWLERNNATVMFVLLLVIGVVLLGRGIGGLID